MTRVKVSAEPRRDGTGRTRRHFTAPGPRPPRWGRAGAAGSDLPCPAPPRGPAGRWRPGFSRDSIGVPRPRRARSGSTAASPPAPARGSAARPRRPSGPGPLPGPSAPRGDGRGPRCPFVPPQRGAPCSGSGRGRPSRGAQQAGLAPARQDGDVAAGSTECIELVPGRGETAPGTAEKPGKVRTRSVSARCNFLKLIVLFYEFTVTA